MIEQTRTSQKEAARATILIVDDEPQFRRLLRTGMEINGYEALEAISGNEGIKLAVTRQPDLIVLDIGLPDADGLSILSTIRQWSQTPVIILSVRNSDTEKVRAFEAGADDYVTKPFSMPEFLARVMGALRRAGQQHGASPVFTVGNLTVDLGNRLVRVDGRQLRLSRKQYKLLQILVTHAGRVVTQEQLMREIWGPAHVGDTHYLRMFVRKLRGKIEEDPSRPRYLVTELGVGYRLRTAEQFVARPP